MTRDGSTRLCAYMDCRKTTDKRTFGQNHKLSDQQRSSYSAWLKQQHDGVVCHSQYSALRSPTRCCDMQGCPSLLLSSPCEHRSAPYMDCMQTMPLRCAH